MVAGRRKLPEAFERPGSRARRQQAFARDGLFYFMIHAQPTASRSGAHRLGGAYVNCWIDFRNREGALLLARHFVRRDGWRIRSVQESTWIDGPARAVRGTLRWYREAQRLGACFVFNTYPRNA